MIPVYLYKNGEQSPQPVYPVDLDLWLKAGWVMPEPEIKTGEVETATEVADRTQPKYLYKNGEQSLQKVHPSDIHAWLNQGWTVDQTASPEAVAVAEPADASAEAVVPVAEAVVSPLDVEIQRLQGLFSARGWSVIKKEAVAHGVKQHNDGWEETIPAIAAAIVAKQ